MWDFSFGLLHEILFEKTEAFCIGVSILLMAIVIVLYFALEIMWVPGVVLACLAAGIAIVKSMTD